MSLSFQDWIKNRARKISNTVQGFKAFNWILDQNDGKGGLALGAAPDDSTFSEKEYKELTSANAPFHLVITLLADDEAYEKDKNGQVDYNRPRYKKLAAFVNGIPGEKHDKHFEIKLSDHAAFSHDDPQKFLIIKETLNKIDELRNENKNVYVHCRQGIGRSATLVMLYLMSKKGLSLKEALETMSIRRPQIDPNPEQIRQACECNFKILIESSEAPKPTIQALEDLILAYTVQYRKLLFKGDIKTLETFIHQAKNLPEKVNSILNQFGNRFSNDDLMMIRKSLNSLLFLIVSLTGVVENLIYKPKKTREKGTQLLDILEKMNSTFIDICGNEKIAFAENLYASDLLNQIADWGLKQFDLYMENHPDHEKENYKEVEAWKNKLTDKLDPNNKKLKELLNSETKDRIEAVKMDMLQEISLETNILLSDNNNPTENDLSELRIAHPNKAILYKTESDEIWISGFNPSTLTWKKLQLDETQFKSLEFPNSEDKTRILKTYELTEGMHKEIHKGHTEPAACRIALLFRLLKEALKKFFMIGVEKRTLNQNFTDLIQESTKQNLKQSGLYLQTNCFSVFRQKPNSQGVLTMEELKEEDTESLEEASAAEFSN